MLRSAESVNLLRGESHAVAIAGTCLARNVVAFLPGVSQCLRFRKRERGVVASSLAGRTRENVAPVLRACNLDRLPWSQS
jgi:hypothetical protein